MRITRAVIPAAGKGTRMNPVTKALPKEMLPLGSNLDFKPFIHYVVEESVKSDVQDILIITRPKKQAIQQYFDTVGVEGLHYKNQREQKGLGDAILQAEAFVNKNSFAVLLGDDFCDCEEPATKQLVKAYEKLPENAALIGVEKLPKEKMITKGMVVVKDFDTKVMIVTNLIEKPSLNAVVSNLAIIGRYILPPEILQILRELPPGHGGEIQLTDAIKKLMENGCPVFAYEIKGKRIDIGSPLTYADALIFKLLADKSSKQETINMLKNHLTEFSSN